MWSVRLSDCVQRLSVARTRPESYRNPTALDPRRLHSSYRNLGRNPACANAAGNARSYRCTRQIPSGSMNMPEVRRAVSIGPSQNWTRQFLSLCILTGCRHPTRLPDCSWITRDFYRAPLITIIVANKTGFVRTRNGGIAQVSTATLFHSGVNLLMQ